MTTTGHRRWGTAGVQLTEEQARVSNARGVARRQAHEEAEIANREIARKKWAAGMVVPHRITMALDMCDLFGPEVDIACGGQEPDVDMWEAGKLYPRWDQLEQLATLTGRPLRWFCEHGGMIDPMSTSMRFHIVRGESLGPPAVYRYPDLVVARCPGTGLAS